MAASLGAFALFQLLQIGLSMQPGNGGPALTLGFLARSHNATNTSECLHPGNGATRMWSICSGNRFTIPTQAEAAREVTVGSEMSCTQEVNLDCLCCMDFAKPLTYNRVGIMALSAAQKTGSPGGMVSNMPSMSQSNDIVLVCSSERAIGYMADQAEKGSSVSLPVQCIRHEFTPAELQGTEALDATSAVPQPGEIVFDERIMFLSNHGGIPKADIPTCKTTVSGTCPTGTPKAQQKPNSAGQETLLKLQNDGDLRATEMTSGTFTMVKK